MIINVNRTSTSQPRYIGHYTVKRKTKGGSYILEGKTGALYPRNVPPNQIKVISENVITPAEGIYEVEAILDHQGAPGNYLYRVRRKGYSEKDDTWEPAEHSDNQSIINNYWRRRHQQPAETETNNRKRKNQPKKRSQTKR
ncbi:hypothetical protein BCV72DRAFT_218214 [Rhizopus microsporus var. microsporus]|uniref:Chromo domain-containing protein n=1 Tax=Rhizopus microsporus var. microsporus TaxID=86635 RepID=A0A1X0QMF2_RHIZD|nr:hypothetical protein BCV72DRAFT_218214 [Rhizopus microsporus var. microsporus]